ARGGLRVAASHVRPQGAPAGGLRRRQPAAGRAGDSRDRALGPAAGDGGRDVGRLGGRAGRGRSMSVTLERTREMTTDLPAPALKPANRLRDPQRDASGKLLPGAALNPTGRPKAWREFQQAVRERTPEALKIIDQSLKSKDPEMRRWACERVLAYAWGRP